MYLDSQKRIILAALAIFFLCDALWVIFGGERALTDLVCSVVRELVMGVIAISFVAGLVCFLFSAFGIGVTANHNLDTLEAELSSYLKSENKQAASKSILAVCSKNLEDLNKENSFRLFGLNTSPRHLYNRLRALGVERGDKDAVSAEQKVSGLQDLHELTMQSELSRPCSSGMNTVISFLLILGILGTLTQVHNVIADGVKDVGALAPALAPSQWAVLFTVILLFLRGFYLCMVDRYMYRLDKLTMNWLRPALSPAQTKEAEEEKAVDNIKETLLRLGQKEQQTWNVEPYADFSDLARQMKAASLTDGETDSPDKESEATKAPAAKPAKKKAKKLKLKVAVPAKETEIKPEGTENKDTEEPEKTELKAADEAPGGQMQTKEQPETTASKEEAAAASAQKAAPKDAPQEPQWEMAEWSAESVVKQVRELKNRVSSATHALAALQQRHRPVSDAAVADRNNIRRAISALQREEPSDQQLQSVQTGLRKRLETQAEMDLVLSRLLFSDTESAMKTSRGTGVFKPMNRIRKGNVQ